MSEGSFEKPTSFEVEVTESEPNQFDVFVTTSGDGGAQRQNVGSYPTRQDAERAANAVGASGERYQGAGTTDPAAPITEPETM